MYSFTRSVIEVQLARMHIGMRKVVSSTKGMEMPSTPIWKVMDPSQARRSTNWNCAVVGSKSRQSSSEIAKVTSVVHSAMKRALLKALSSSARRSPIRSAPNSGRKVMAERIGQL